MTTNGASPDPSLALTGRGRRIVIDASGEGPFQIPCYVILSLAKISTAVPTTGVSHAKLSSIEEVRG